MLPGLADILGGIQAISGQKSNISVKDLKGQYALRSPSSLGFLGVFFFLCVFLIHLHRCRCLFSSCVTDGQ